MKRINWLNTIFLTVTPLVAIVGTVFLCIYNMVSWPTWVLMGGLILMSGLSITAGYHRLFSHQTYRAAWPVRLIFALFGAACFQGSILEWSTDHRNHHRYTDSDRDPYSINKGFWYAHIGWLFVLDPSKRDFSNVEDLAKDPIVRFQHKFYPFLAVIMGFGVPAAIAAIWGDALSGFVLAGAMRATFNHHVTFCINSICHLFGRRTYSTKQSARDNWFTALFTYGEGYHNFHHQFPLDYRNGIRWYDYDPTKWLITGLRSVGLASNLKKVSEAKIIKYRVHNDHNNITQLFNKYSEQLITQMSHIVRPVHDRILALIHQIEELEKHYKKLKLQKMETVNAKLDDYRETMALYRKKLKHHRKELKGFLQVWKKLTKRRLIASHHV